jgi:hypothetical protein
MGWDGMGREGLGFLIYEEMHKYLTTYEEAVSHL